MYSPRAAKGSPENDPLSSRLSGGREQVSGGSAEGDRERSKEEPEIIKHGSSRGTPGINNCV